MKLLYYTIIPFILQTPIHKPSTMSSSTTQPPLNHHQLQLLTKQILNTNSLHFITISLLFLPLTIATVNSFSVTTIITVKTLLTLLTVILPTVAGIALITYSTNQAINHTPLTFSSTLKSLKHSYIPLLHTIISGLITLIIPIFAFTLISSIIVNKGSSVKSLGFQFHYHLLLLIFQYALGLAITYIITIWGSAAAITVLESKSGFEALRQSASQSNEFRNNSLSIVFITGFPIGMSLWYASNVAGTTTTSYWILGLEYVAIYLDPMLMILMYVVANTVLYVQCKVGEEMAVDDGVGFREGAKEVANGGFSYMLYLLIMVWVILLCRQLYIIFMLMNKYS